MAMYRDMLQTTFTCTYGRYITYTMDLRKSSHTIFGGGGEADGEANGEQSGRCRVASANGPPRRAGDPRRAA